MAVVLPPMKRSNVAHELGRKDPAIKSSLDEGQVSRNGKFLASSPEAPIAFSRRQALRDDDARDVPSDIGVKNDAADHHRIVVVDDAKEAVMSAECESINIALREHQRGVECWDFTSLVSDLHGWADRFTVEFKLQIGIPCISIEHLGAYRLGHFRPGRNGFGLRDKIALNVYHVRRGTFGNILGTLLHEQLHVWQEKHGKHGKRNYHNKKYRRKASSLGLLVDSRGHTRYLAGETPFSRILRKYGVEPPEATNPEDRESSPILSGAEVSLTGSKLKLYECPCGVKVRIGRSRFHAQCLDCGGLFGLKDKAVGSTRLGTGLNGGLHRC